VIRPPRVDLPAAGVGIANQNPIFERINGPVSCAPMITGALDQTGAAAFRLSPAFGKLAERIELATKQATLIDMLRAPEGATIEETMVALDWAAHFADVLIMPACVCNPA
jgi:hypothetical protein